MAKQKKNKTPLAIRFVSWIFPKLERIAPSLANRYFIYIFFTPFHYKEPEKEKEFLSSATWFHLTMYSKRVQCYRWGNAGPRVMCVHGWAGRAGQFREMVPALVKAGFQVYAFDGPAHGRSEGKQTNMIDFGWVMQRLVENEGEFSGIIGHSFGGIAAMYAIAHGLNIPRLITISSPTLPGQVLDNYRAAINATEKVIGALNNYHQKKFGKNFEQFSGIYSVTTLMKPLGLLLVQDENDPEVAVDNATEVKTIYPAANILLTRGLGHTRILRDEEVIKTCVKFLRS